MPNLISKSTTYEFTTEEIEKMLVDAMGVKREAVAIRFVIEERGGDPMDRWPGSPTLVKVNVTVDNTKL
jgi:hypothetical protein